MPTEMLHDLASFPIILHIEPYTDQHLHALMHEPDQAQPHMEVEPSAAWTMPTSNVIAVDLVQQMEDMSLQHTPNDRGGAKSSKNRYDPKAWMHAWALDKIQRELPSMSQAQASFLLRAEARTVNAVLNAKSTMQLQEVITAAKRRADIMQGEAVAAAATDAGPTTSTSEQIIATQNIIINQLTQLQTSHVSKPDLAELWHNLQIQQAVQVQHMQQMLARIEQLEKHITAMQNVFPNPTEPSPTPVYSEMAPEEMASENQQHPGQQQPQPLAQISPPGLVDLSTSSPEPNQSEPSFLKALEEKSLHNQCQRVVGLATQPFRAARS